MEEDTLLVCRKSKIIMQEGREVQGKSAIRLILTLYDYCFHSCKVAQAWAQEIPRKSHALIGILSGNLSSLRNPNLSSVDKFKYLKSLLTGTAQSSVAGLALTSANYEKAVDLLKQRFGHRQMVISSHIEVLTKLPKVYTWAACKIGITSNPPAFVQLSMDALKGLEENSKPNLILRFCQELALPRPNNAGPLIQLHRMRFGLIQ